MPIPEEHKIRRSFTQKASNTTNALNLQDAISPLVK